MGLSRSTYYHKGKASVQKCNDDSGLLERLMEIKANHPFWGYRRAWGFLNFHLDYKVSQRKVRKLMKDHGLSLKERPKKAVRKNKTSKPKGLKAFGALI